MYARLLIGPFVASNDVGSLPLSHVQDPGHSLGRPLKTQLHLWRLSPIVDA